MSKKLEEILGECRNQIDKIVLITKGKLHGDLLKSYEKLSGLCQEAIQEIQVSTGKIRLGKHQHHPELQAIAGGKFIPRLFS